MPARPLHNDALDPSNPHLRPTAVSVPRPYSGSRLELPACRQLGILIRSRYQSHIRLAHEFSCRKHGVPSGSHRTFRISGPGLWIDCGQYWSTRPGEPRATGTDGALASCRSSRQLKSTPSSRLVREITGFQPKTLKVGVSQHPLASNSGKVFLISRLT